MGIPDFQFSLKVVNRLGLESSRCNDMTNFNHRKQIKNNVYVHTLLTRPSVLLALATILLICLDHDKSFDTVTPRSGKEHNPFIINLFLGTRSTYYYFLCKELPDLKVRKLLYCALVRPIKLEYASSLWSPCAVKYRSFIENVQRGPLN
jgi:hypothetical protein